MTPPATIDMTAGFAGEVLGPIPIDEAASRIRVYCTSRYSGWAVYDLAGVSARSAALLTEVTAWSLLFANALNGRVELIQFADFNRTRRREFADRIGRIPGNRDLRRMTDDEIAAVVHACQFGFDGAWAPRITKLGALYRPAAIPVLDGYVGTAFGSRRDDLSVKVQRFGLNREERIAAIVRAMAGVSARPPGCGGAAPGAGVADGARTGCGARAGASTNAADNPTSNGRHHRSPRPRS
jgi:hypothetical protein